MGQGAFIEQPLQQKKRKLCVNAELRFSQ